MLKNIKKYKKTIFSCIICSVLFCFIGAGATSLIYSKDVSYDNSKSGLSSTTVQGALDELYEKVGNTSAKLANIKLGVINPEASIYPDNVEKGRYIYRGDNVKNYIKFNGETWRIISIESDGTLKIISRWIRDFNFSWDNDDRRVNEYNNNQTSTYCKNLSSGCNAWAATSNLVNNPSSFVQYYPNGATSDSNNYSGTIKSDASLNTYLNNSYYNNFSTSAKKYMVKGTFNVSTPGNTSNNEKSLEIDAKEEAQYKWKGYVGLITVTELLRASTNPNCVSLGNGITTGGTSSCISNNWLWPNFDTDYDYDYEWTISPATFSFATSYVWFINKYGCQTSESTASYAVRPVVFLSKDITLKGTGSSTDPYVITN